MAKEKVVLLEAATNITSFKKQGSGPITYPAELTLICEFDGPPTLDLFQITAPDNWTKSGEFSVSANTITAKFKTPKENKDNCKFIATYNKTITKELLVNVLYFENLFKNIETNKSIYKIGEIVTATLKFENNVEFERDKPTYKNISDGLIELTGPIIKDKEISYTFRAIKKGPAKISFGCYEGLKNETSRGADITINQEYAESEYKLIGDNFTSVGNNFITLRNKKLKLSGEQINFIKAADDLVKLGILARIS